ncbi:MAG: MFS transporter [Caulobacter sp.]|nr:MFS transporter [Caulobacter sp.]
MTAPKTGLRAVPRTVWALGLVSMFTDISSEIIHSLLPVFLVTGLGASVALVGLIEGVSEATASITKLFSGWISDRLGKRKLLVLIGYGLATLTKPIFPLAVTPFEVMAARFADRIGKGIRGAPRDALIADITPNGGRGAAYGLRQSLDTVGAFVGPLVAMALMVVLAGDMRAVFAWAVVPAMIAVVLIVIGVEEPRGIARSVERGPPIRLADVRGMGRRFWSIVLLGVVFTLARFSEAFLILRAQGVGLPIALVPLVLVIMNVVYAGVAAPVGALSDRIGRRKLLAAGLVVLLAADLVLTLFGGVAGVLVGVALWGLHLGLTQGLLSTLVADAAPAPLRATAFGLFNLATGLSLLAASVIAGLLWATFGAQATFLAGAGFTLVALTGLILAGPRHRDREAAD